MKKVFQKLLIIGGILYLSIIMIANLFQKNIIFRPVKLAKDYTYQFNAPFEEDFVKMPDDCHINTLFFKTTFPKKGIILYFHGNADNLQRWGKMHEDFTSRGYDFLVMDYRGYGKSEGEVSELKFYEDALYLYLKVKETYAVEDIIIYGRSLGTAVASNLAAQVPAKMLILETPFDNMRNLFRLQMRFIRIPLFLKYFFPTDKHIQKVNYPIHIFHGTKDRIVPYSSAKNLQKYLKPKDQFITIPKGKHKNLGSFQEFQDKLNNILK